MKPIIPLVVAGVILSVGTVFEGLWTERWFNQSSEKLERFTKNLENVRQNLRTFHANGYEWIADDKEIDQETFKASGCTGCVSRQYRRSDGATVDVFLVSGHSRHITIHTPEWCYPGAGFNTEGDAKSVTINAEGMATDPEFLSKVFSKEDPVTGPMSLKIFWSYTEDGKWRGPRMPKPEYGNRPALFKVYLILSLSNQGQDDESLKEFASEFMPRATELLFAEPEVAKTPPAASDTASST